MDFLMVLGQAVLAEGATAPFDRIKHVCQLRSELRRLGRLPSLPPHAGDAHHHAPAGRVVGRVIEVEGLLGLWRGFLPQILAYFPSQSITFALRDYFTMHLFDFAQQWTGVRSADNQDSDTTENYFKPPGSGAGAAKVAIWFASRVAAGALAGAATLSIFYPLHFANVQLLADVGRPSVNDTIEYQFSGILDVWRQAVARSGPRGLYHGLEVSLVGMLLFRGLYFGVYDLAMYLMPSRLRKQDWICFLTALSVTVGSAFVAYPIDTVRRRLMVAALTPQAYAGAIQCAKEIWRTEGLYGFFAGATANVFVCSVAPFVYLACDSFLSGGL